MLLPKSSQIQTSSQDKMRDALVYNCRGGKKILFSYETPDGELLHFILRPLSTSTSAVTGYKLESEEEIFLTDDFSCDGVSFRGCENKVGLKPFQGFFLVRWCGCYSFMWKDNLVFSMETPADETTIGVECPPRTIVHDCVLGVGTKAVRISDATECWGASNSFHADMPQDNVTEIQTE